MGLDGPAAAEELSFAASESVWFNTFLQAWGKATRVITLPKCLPDTISRCHKVLQNGVCSKVPSTLCPTTCRIRCQPSKEIALVRQNTRSCRHGNMCPFTATRLGGGKMGAHFFWLRPVNAQVRELVGNQKYVH